MSTDRKFNRDEVIKKLTAEYDSLKSQLEDARSNPDQMININDLKRELKETFKDLCWMLQIRDMEEKETKKKETPE